MSKKQLSLGLLISFSLVCAGDVKVTVSNGHNTPTEMPQKKSVIQNPSQTSANTLFVQAVEKKAGIIRRLGNSTGKLVGSAFLFTAILAYKQTKDAAQSTTAASDNIKKFCSNWFDTGYQLYEAGAVVYTDAAAQTKNLAALIGLTAVIEKIMKKESSSENKLCSQDEPTILTDPFSRKKSPSTDEEKPKHEKSLADEFAEVGESNPYNSRRD